MPVFKLKVMIMKMMSTVIMAMMIICLMVLNNTKLISRFLLFIKVILGINLIKKLCLSYEVL